MLQVREIFTTLQGEGSLTGSPSIFIRFAGCNLWSGLNRYRNRGKGDCAAWCDTDFAKGEPWDVDALVAHVEAETASWGSPLVVLTGGEPLLQLRTPAGVELIRKLKARSIRTAIETNGTVAVPEEVQEHLDHITVSPKGLVGKGASMDHIKVRQGTDLKVVCPSPFDIDALMAFGIGFRHCYVQPKDVGDIEKNAENFNRATQVAKTLGWRVSVQVHKLVGLP